MIPGPASSRERWSLPREDYWSTPFAEALLQQLDLFPGASILDVACGDGIPAFYLAEQVGPTGQVLAIDWSEGRISKAKQRQGAQLPWLQFQCCDLRTLPPDLSRFDRVTGNLSVMFFRPNRYEVVRGLVRLLKPGGQLVLTFPSLGTFDSLWTRIDQEMARCGLIIERERLKDYIVERPSGEQGRNWLEQSGLVRVQANELPLEVATGAGLEFLQHPLLRGGFLDDVYECFADQQIADDLMIRVSQDLPSFLPLIARRCVLSGWKHHEEQSDLAPHGQAVP